MRGEKQGPRHGDRCGGRRSRLRPWPALLVTALFGLLLPTGTAAAHGGRYRGPSAGIAPGRGQDPTPPPPPELLRPEAPGQARSAPRTLDDWPFWYHHNNEGIERLKRVLLWRVGCGFLWPPDPYGFRRRKSDSYLLRKKTERVIVPALLRAMDPDRSGGPEVAAAAHIALAKVTTDPMHVLLIQRGLRHRTQVVVPEAAAIALGLLRRDDPRTGFDAEVFDEVRRILFGLVANEERTVRVRGFAALALGLLGDQASGGAGSGTPGEVIERLFRLLQTSNESVDLRVGLLMAIGLQPPGRFTSQQRKVLRACTTRGHLLGPAVPGVVRSYAALALGRIGVDKDIKLLQALMPVRRVDRQVRRSCALGLGHLGCLVIGENRRRVARTLAEAGTQQRDCATRNFALMSLAQVMEADLSACKTGLLTAPEIGGRLLGLAAEGQPLHRAYAALALGKVAAAIDEDSKEPAHVQFLARSLVTLRAGLSAQELPERTRAAFALALGQIGNWGDRKTLMALVSDRRRDLDLRSYAALALGLIGGGTADVLVVLRKALAEGHSGLLRLQAATAMALVCDRQVVPMLLAELTRTEAVPGRVQILGVLGKVGRHDAVDPLVAVLEDREEPLAVRAAACAALGRVGDLQWVSSYERLSRGINFRASTSLVHEMLSLH